MRLAIVRQRYTPYGGAERFIERALAALAARGVELTIVTRAWPRDAAPGATPLIVDPPHLGRTWRQWSFDRGACAALARAAGDAGAVARADRVLRRLPRR